MDKKQIKAITGSIKKLACTDNFDLLRLVTSKIELEVDSDYVYFNYIDGARPIPIAAIYGVLVENHCLYILTRNKELHSISLINREHNVDNTGMQSVMFEIDVFLYKLKLLFNIKK